MLESVIRAVGNSCLWIGAYFSLVWCQAKEQRASKGWPGMGLARGWCGQGLGEKPLLRGRGGEGAVQRHCSAGAGDSLQHSLRVPFCLIMPVFPIRVIFFLLVFKSFSTASNLCLRLLSVFLVGKFIFKY